MDCVNHSGTPATAFCQNCGKALCANCIRTGAAGQILCEPCWMAWQTVPNPFVGAPVGVPNPAAAAVLGLIPGVGAMYNGQFFKGLIHVVIFAVLISITDHYAIFGLFIAAWILYQSFEAYHTALARRDGQPLPDPLGLNEVGNWLNLGGHRPGQPGAGPVNPANPPSGTTGATNPNWTPPGTPGAGPGFGNPGFGSQGFGSQGSGSPGSGSQGAGPYQPPYAGGQPPYTGYQPPFQAPYTPVPGYTDPAVPPVPPAYWRRKEPIGAIVLIGLGLLFLLGQLDIFSGRLLEYTWPVLLIGLGVWLILRRMGETKGGSK